MGPLAPVENLDVFSLKHFPRREELLMLPARLRVPAALGCGAFISSPSHRAAALFHRTPPTTAMQFSSPGYSAVEVRTTRRRLGRGSDSRGGWRRVHALQLSHAHRLPVAAAWL